MRKGIPTNKQLAAGHRRQLETISKKIKAMSCEWAETEYFIEMRFEQLARSVDQLVTDLHEPDGVIPE